MQYTRLEQDIIDNMERGLENLDESSRNIQKIKIDFFKKGILFRYRQAIAQKVLDLYVI